MKYNRNTHATKRLENFVKECLKADFARIEILEGLIAGGFHYPQAVAYIDEIEKGIRKQAQAQTTMRQFLYGMVAIAVASVVSLAINAFPGLTTLYYGSWMVLALGVFFFVRALNRGVLGQGLVSRSVVPSTAQAAIILVGGSNIIAYIA